MYQRPQSGYCPTCQGQGVTQCWSCNGSGKCTASYYHTDFLGGKKVVYCQNGWCPRCKGSGVDKGFLLYDKCPMCNGNKYCPTCGGSSKCPTCGGTGKTRCQTCGGRGR